MSQTQINWETLLASNKIEVQHVDFALNNIDSAPKLPYEFVYKQFSDKIYYPEAIAISGSGGVIGAILSTKYAYNNISYFITTEDVIKATQNSPLFLAKYALEKLSKIYQNAEVIILRINDFDKIKMLLKGGIYISGLPYEIVVQLAQLAGFGKLWHYSPFYKKFYIF
jgi:hypothetical protein